MQQINVNELKPHPRNNEFFDDMSGEKVFRWLLLKQNVSKGIELNDLASKIYNASSNLYNPFFKIRSYEQFLNYQLCNFRGGANDKNNTKHEYIFAEIFPFLEKQVTFGTGKQGLKKYGVKKYTVDFLDKTAKIVIEIDGLNHNTKIQRLKDEIRKTFFIEHSYFTIRFSNNEVENLYKLYLNTIAMEVKNEQRNNTNIG